jgi:two-component system sensor histidine kinase AgrC
MMNLNISNAAILGVIASKYEVALSKNINFNIIANDKIEEICCEILLLCEFLGIMIDNAIEAAEKSKLKFVSIKIEENEDEMIFQIENSFEQEPDINKIFKKGFSTKGKGRGLGLWYIKSKLTKEKNIFLNTSINGDYFKHTLQIRRKFHEDLLAGCP